MAERQMQEAKEAREAEDAQKALITALEKEAQTYKAGCHLTDDFFCKFDAQKERMMKFQKLPDGDVRPCCVDVVDRELEEQNRANLMSKLMRVQDRITKFRELVVSVQKERTIFLTPEKDAVFEAQQEALDKVARSIQKRLHVCLEPLFAEGHVTLQQFPQHVCEPMEDLVANIQSAFFPPMFALEQLIGKERQELIDNSIRTRIGEWVSWGWSKLTGSIQAVAKVIRTILGFVYTWGVEGFRRFGYATGSAMTNVIQVICGLRNESSFGNYYNLMYAFLKRNMERASVRTIVANSFQQFANSNKTKGMLLYIAQAVKDIGESRKLERMIVIGDDMIKFANQPYGTTYDKSRLLKWMYMVCVYSFDLIYNLVTYAFKAGCATYDVLQTYFSMAYNVTVYRNPEQAKAQADVEEANDIEDLDEIPVLDDLTDESDKSDVEENAAKEELAKTCPECVTDTSAVVRVLFRMFVFFSKNRYIPKEDLDPDLKEYQTTATGPVNLMKLNNVPDYVRFAYCRGQAQFQTATGAADCHYLVNKIPAVPILGQANAVERYREYMAKEKDAYLRGLQVLSEEQIRAKIMQAVREHPEMVPAVPVATAPVLIVPATTTSTGVPPPIAATPPPRAAVLAPAAVPVAQVIAPTPSVPAQSVGLLSRRGPPPERKAAPTLSRPTMVPTAAVPTAAVPIAAVPTAAVPIAAVPTAAVPIATVPTAAVPVATAPVLAPSVLATAPSGVRPRRPPPEPRKV